jgi:hypothetical protein
VADGLKAAEQSAKSYFVWQAELPMKFSIKSKRVTAEFRWQQVTAFTPDPQRKRFYDSILDFGCFRSEIDFLALDSSLAAFCGATPVDVLVAGKFDAPDPDALALAIDVVSDLSRALSGVMAKCHGLRFGPHDWELRALWFPYQSYGTFWFARLETEYDGQFELAFRQDHDGAVCLGDSGDSFPSSAPSTVRQCVESLHYLLRQAQSHVVQFEEVLRRIAVDRIFGPEIVPALKEVLQLHLPEIPAREYRHLKTLLDHLGEPTAAPELKD